MPRFYQLNQRPQSWLQLAAAGVVHHKGGAEMRPMGHDALQFASAQVFIDLHFQTVGQPQPGERRFDNH